jgi:hypothetical protein
MATSGSTNWSATRNDIITQAYRKIGALGENETISSTQLTIGAASLNPMIKKLSAKGMPVWAMRTLEIDMSFITAAPTTIGPTGTIPTPKPLKIVQAIRKDSLDGSEVPLEIKTWEDYNNLTDKTSTGTPVHLFYHPRAYDGHIYLWQLPDSYWTTNGKLVIRYQRPFEDFDAAADEPDFPTEWHETLMYQLAVRLAPEYGLATLDRQLLMTEAKEMLKDSLDFDQEEGSFYIRPNWRS